MKIALINENSQAAKNGIIEAALKKVVEPMGHPGKNQETSPLFFCVKMVYYYTRYLK